MRNILLAERFGCTPLDIEEGDSDRWLPYFQAMAIEAEVRGLAFGLAPDDPLNLDDTDAEVEEPNASG